MAESVVKSYFPSQVVSDAEKLSYDYGLKIAKAIEQEWFNKKGGSSRYSNAKNSFHNLRLYARGEQSIQKYKDELSINGDLSYLNLDWKPVPIIPKFVDIVVNGIAERTYDIKAFSQDPYGVSKRTEYMEYTWRSSNVKTLPLGTERVPIDNTCPFLRPVGPETLGFYQVLTKQIASSKK